MSVAQIGLTSLSELLNGIELKRKWEPQLSMTLQQNPNLPTFLKYGGARPGGSTGSTTTTTMTGSVANDLTECTGTLLQAYLQQLASQGYSIGGGWRNTSTTDEQSTKAKNPDFHDAIFGEFRKCTVKEKPVKSKDIC